MNFKHYLSVLLLLVALTSVACQGNSAPLPTLAVIASATAEVTEAAQTATENVAASDATGEASAVVSTQTPVFSQPSDAESATQAALIAPNFTPPPTTDAVALMGDSDLSAAAVGDTVSMIGILTVEGEAVIVTNDEGSSLRINIPAPMAETLVDKQVYVAGVVASTEGGITLHLLTIREMVEATAGAPVVLPSFDVTPESTPETLEIVTVDMQLGANLSALTAYDQLIGQIAGQLGNRVWISSYGSPSAGWSFDFYDAADQSVVIYLVLPDGTVQRQAGIPPLGVTEVFALDRASLVVDSDDLLETYAESGRTDEVETLVLLLQAVDEDSAQWSILDVEGLPLLVVDAISGDVVR